MMKRKHQPTAQDLYRARKQREEQEKDARLPPGFVNHGNTCFMNSTLQGLLATELLYDLVKFQPLPPSIQSNFGSSVLAHRSPQLTNGHGLGGEHERPWQEGMPLGDVFIDVMRKAWDIREGRTRQNLTPKEVLFTIGKKYDQYMDFRQQDAHEFLRHMLDAMRMEELDIIKQRQPPPKESRKRSRRKRTLPPAPSLDATLSTPGEDERLQSFVDMLFGGHLASILVCEKCKKVSLTYEEFNDLSLSIKPEDYSKDRKRDRFKQFARKLRGPFRPPGPRSSSVPPTDRLRRSIETPTHEEEPPTNEGPRRKSFDHTTGENVEREEALDEVTEMVHVGGPPPAIAVDDPEVGADGSEEKDEQESDSKDEEGKKDKGDPWGRLGRRLSVSVRMGMKALDPGSPSRSVERGRKVRHKDKEQNKDKADRTPVRVAETEAVRTSIRTSIASAGSAYDSGSDTGDQSDGARMRLGSASPTPSPLSNPPITAAFSNPRSHNIRRLTGLKGKHKNSARPPKPSREEQVYLRQLLADIHVASNNPFTALQQVITTGQTHTTATQTAWAKMGHLPGIEECLRMFTAVEILDGENMVGCHRCWKIAHGLYKPKRRDGRKGGDNDDDEARSEDEDENEDEDSGISGLSDRRNDLDSMIAQKDATSASSETFSSSPDLSIDGRVSPASTSALHSTHSASSLSDVLSDNTSAVSAPTTVSGGLSLTAGNEGNRGRLYATGMVGRMKPTTYGGLPIPSISTTGPESSSPSPPTPSVDNAQPDGSGTPRRRPGNLDSSSDDVLLTPRGRRRSKTPELDGDSDTSASDYESDTDVSASTSAYSDATSAPSASPSPAVSPHASMEDLPTARPEGAGKSGAPQASPSTPAVSKSKQVILRRMYKRYLISDAPPILVVHLKRFQQTSKTHSVSFSSVSGVKKLDDYVSFPELLDIGPFLAPRRENYSLDEDGKVKVKHADKEQRQCMYRLYAVVVHIGNMLGGHYIAYTALPPPHCATSPPSTPAAEPLTSASASLSGSSASEHGTKHQQSTTRQWAYISDTIVRLTTIEEVLKAKAYICMYERI
ncbi:cysteine proteinase [Daedalea quercina L-15889]|uniref:Cysteine proteinase n=1 Tax=Daedalea quercina L-15889 TaxID=1314783 RepID=A0A165R9P4_9APHY|nr:cysteine proteinase [Daedalea quercina L-15889]